MLDVQATSNNLKGVLIPRVPLTSLTDNSNINNGKTANSLLVFNITDNEELRAGYYYWFETSWIRLMTDQDNISRDIPNNDEFAVNFEEQTLYLKDTDQNIVSAPLSDINILTTLENKGKGNYVYTSENKDQTSIDVVGDVINNFEDIITNEDVQNTLNQYFNTALPLGNVTYVKEGDSYVFKYLDEKGDNQTIDISAIVKSLETITTITAEQVEGKNTGKYVYKNEELAEVTIDVVGDVINNFDEIISNEDVQNTLNQYFTNALPLGNVTYVKEGDSYVFKYLDEKGDNQTIDISAIVKSLETITTITAEQIEGKNTGKYVYKNEELAEVTIDVVGDVINNFDEIISNEEVQNNLYLTIGANAKDLSSDTSIVVTKGDKVLLNEASIAIAESGIITKHIHNKAVTTDKISSEGITTNDKVLTTNGIGGAEFKDMSLLVESVSKGNIEGNESIAVEGGIDAIFGGEDKKVTLGLKKGGVKENHLAATSVSTTKLQTGAVTTDKVANANITAAKLTADVGKENRVAIANENGVVTYKPIDSSVIDGVGSIVTDDIIHVVDGKNKTLGEVSLSINDTSIPASKLTAEGAEINAVATAGVDGEVTYKPITTSILTGAGDITTDGVVTVDNGKGKVLNNVVLGLATNSITNDHLQKDAVTTDKIKGLNVTIDKLGSGEEEENSVITTDGHGGFRYATVAQLQSQAFDLTTDEVIEVLEGGENAVLTETKIGIKNNTITREKLNSKGQEVNMLLVTDGQGGFDYVKKEAVQAGGVDMKLDPALTFTSGDGLNAVLAPMTISVANQGIQTSHIADASVTTTKINAEKAATNTVLTAIGEGKVAYKSMNDLVFNEGKDLKADGSITVATGNKALLKETAIAVANQGIQTSHIADASVTTTKINAEKAATNTVLTAIGEGKVAYKSMNDLVFNQGKELSSDESIIVSTGKKAVLNEAKIAVRESGIKANHLANASVTTDKINSGEATNGFVLVADGDGGVKYEDINTHISIEGQELEGVGAIEVKNGEYALLSTASVDIKKGGVTTDKLADGAVNTSKIENRAVKAGKISSTVITQGVEKTYDKGSVLVADGKGGVSYESLSAQGKKVSTDYSITVKDGDKAVLNDMTISVATNGITEEKIKNDAVTFTKLRASSVYGTVVKDKGVTAAKISSDTATEGDVLTADGKGGASFKKASGTDIDYSKVEQIKDVKWLDTDKKVAQRVFEIELTKAENKITVDGDFASVILDARLINQSTNSVTRGLIRKEVSNGKTILVLGTPGTVTVKHPKGKYYLIVEYVKK
jgi:ribonuclease HI